MLSVDAAAAAVATSLVHAIVGRVVASVVLDGRAWDPGIVAAPRSTLAYASLDAVAGFDRTRFWAIVGDAVIGAAT